MNRKDLKFLLVSIVLLTASFSFVRNTRNTIQNNKRFEEMREEVSRLNREKAELQEDLAFQESDEFIEQEARNRLNMVKPNEELFVLGDNSSLEINEEDTSIGTQRVVSKKQNTKTSNFVLWVNLLF